MKIITTLFHILLFTFCLLSFHSCRKSETKMGLDSNFFDSILTINLVVHVKNVSNWPEVGTYSSNHQSTSTTSKLRNQMDGKQIIYASTGDSTKLNACTDTLHYHFISAISATQPTDISIILETPSNGKGGGPFQLIIFTYYPASKTMTSIINPLNINNHENTNTQLDPDTDFSTMCSTHEVNLYIRCK